MSTTDSTVSVVHNPARRRKHSKEIDPPNMRIVLLGKDVSTNSGVGNLMLGRSAFDSEAPPDDHQIERVRGKDMMIINCPHLLQLNLSYHQIIQTVRECVDLSHPGPHVILLIFKHDECSREDQERLEMILNYFSDSVYQHTLVLTTHDSHSDHQTEVNDSIQKIIKKSLNRHYRLKRNCTAAHLIETFRDIIKSNDGHYLICDKYKDSQSFTLKQQTDERDPPEMRDDVRIVLLGKTGVGKSATGNTILNRQAFISEVSVESVTSECQKQTAEINNRLITVIDTPGLFDTERSHEEIKREMMNCISMILPGPHVFIIVLSLAQHFTEEESRSVKIIQEMFGENSLMFTMVLFTRGDQLRNKTIEECLGKPGSGIRNLIEECGNRYHVFNNNLTEDQTQVSLLLEKIDDMVKTNGDDYYSSKIFREMEREKHEQQIKKLMDKIKELRRVKEEQERQMRDEMRKKRDTLKNEMEDVKKENKNLLMKYETQTDKLMNTIENHERERKRREDEFREKDERYNREIKEKEEQERQMRDEMRREREEHEKQRQEERQRREEDEKEKQIYVEQCEKLKSEMNEIMKEKERIEKEKEDQLEEFEKRIKDERNMREEQEKRYEDKLKLMKEENEEELKRRTTEMIEKHEREKEDQLEEFEKRIKEERNMREEQEKRYEDKLKLMKEEKEEMMKEYKEVSVQCIRV